MNSYEIVSLLIAVIGTVALAVGYILTNSHKTGEQK